MWPLVLNASTWSTAMEVCDEFTYESSGTVVDVTAAAQQAHATEMTVTCVYKSEIDGICYSGDSLWLNYATPVRGANNDFWPAPYKADCVSPTNDTICASVAVEASVPPPLQCSFPATGGVYHCANTTKLLPLSSVGGAYLLNLRISPISCDMEGQAFVSASCTLSLQ
jgi:hypothetical protein